MKPGRIAVYSAFVAKGAFREYYIDCDGKEFNKTFCFKGDFTGSYYDLNSGKPSVVAIEALADSTVVIIDYKKLRALAEADPFWLRVLYLSAHRALMRKFEKERQLLTMSASHRYAILQQEYPELEQLVPAYQLASYLGITPISLSRIRAQKEN